jgi:hypothetical protein
MGNYPGILGIFRTNPRNILIPVTTVTDIEGVARMTGLDREKTGIM